MTTTLATAARPPARSLVGRSELLALLDAALAAGDSVLIDGPHGIGKSVILDALAASARTRGELVLRVSGAESERWMDYQHLADLLAQLPPDYLDGLPSPQRIALRATRRGRRAAGDGRGQTARRLGWHAVLTRCAAKAPVLLLVDDAHCLDTATADVFGYAARRLEGYPVRVVVAGRWPEPDQSAFDLMPPPVTRATVPPLTADDVADLLDLHGLPVRTAAKVHADTAGNPYLALAVVAGTGEYAQSRLHGLIAAKVAQLPESVRETLLRCALATTPTIRLLLRAGRPDAEADIDRAVDAGLVVTDGENIRFTPPDAATVIARGVSGGRRAEVHLELAEVVTFAAEVDRHRALASADPDGEVARSLVDGAESALRRGARALAAELYLLAADRTPPGWDSCRVEWLLAAAEVGAQANLAELVEPAVTAVLDADAEPAQRVRARLARLVLSGQGVSMMEETLAAAHADAEGDPASLARTHLWRAWAAMIGGDPTKADTEAAAAVEQAELAADTTSQAMALTVRAHMCRVLGRPEYPHHLARALALADPGVDGMRHLGPRFIAARFAVFDDRHHEARTDLLGMLGVVERGTADELFAVLISLAEVSSGLGRCREALDYAARAIQVAGAAGLSPGPAWFVRALAELAGGSLPTALSYADRGVRACEEEGDVLYERKLLHLVAQARSRLGDVAGAVATLRRLRELEVPRGFQDPTMPRWHADLAAGLVALGEPGAADQVLTEVRAAVADRTPAAGFEATLDRAEAAVRAATGDTERAAELVRGARAVFAELGQPIEEGHCLLVEAKIERRRRHYTAARAAAEAAVALFTSVGALPWTMEAKALLELLGDVGDTGGVLTASEARVAAMVGEGASNQEIADALYLSRKTIEATLTRIYRKLGIRSRNQLIRRLHTD